MATVRQNNELALLERGDGRTWSERKAQRKAEKLAERIDRRLYAEACNELGLDE